MLMLGDLVRAPERAAGLGAINVLIAADGVTEALVNTEGGKRESTMVFEHETIQMMRAEQAKETAKLSALVADNAVVLPMRKRQTSFWDNITLGRSSSADIIIDDPAISGVHAHFIRAPSGAPMEVQDVGSSNGTFLNRQPLQPHEATPLRSGDCLRFGQTVLYFVSAKRLRALVAYRRGEPTS